MLSNTEGDSGEVKETMSFFVSDVGRGILIGERGNAMTRGKKRRE